MPINNPHSVDRAYKFNYKMLGIIFHRYMYHEGDRIEFIETEIPNTGQRKDMMVKVDDELIQITEFMSKALSKIKLKDLFEYHVSTLLDHEYEDFNVRTGVFSIAEPDYGIDHIEIDENVSFNVETIFTKNKDAWKILSTLVYKSCIQEVLSFEEAVDLLVIPDMRMGKKKNMEMPIKALMKMIIVLMGKLKFPSFDLKLKIFLCQKMTLARFFTGEELDEMINMLKTATKNPKIQRKIEEYGFGFDEIYKNGLEDGFTDGFADGKSAGKRDVALKLVADGVDVEIVSRNTGISVSELEKYGRKL